MDSAQAQPQPASLPLSTVVFELATQRYGLPVTLVREIVLVPALLELAGASLLICGLLNYRGAYVPVIDGRAMVGAASLPSIDNQIILVGADQPELGLLVDHVVGVYDLDARQSTALDAQAAAAFLAAIATTADGPVLLLDYPALQALAPALSQASQR